MEYKTGLNVDIKPFNPSGDRESGGIYFSREDILSFLEHGCWIREVTLPEGEEIYENPGRPKKWKAHRVILGERKKIDLEVIKELVDSGASIHSYNNCAIMWASSKGHLDVVRYFVENGANSHVGINRALRWASSKGHLDVVRYFVEKGADIHTYNNDALKLALRNGHMAVVRYLKTIN